MTLEFQTVKYDFPIHSGSAQVQEKTFQFATAVRNVSTAINSFNIGYSNADHHLLRTKIDTTATVVGSTAVVCKVDFSLRDNSGEFDDPYNGNVEVLLIIDRV
jgi:hypothetical protein